MTSILPAKGVGPRIARWIFDFIEGRSFRVKVNGSLSRAGHVMTRCPQGTVLGLDLFLFFVDPSVSLYIHADDIKFVKPIEYPEKDCLTLQKALNGFHVWTRKSGLRLSVNKYL